MLAYFSGVAALTPAVRAALGDTDAVFFDGTFWSSDELIALGVGEKRAEEMAHLPVGGPGGSLAALRALRAPRRVYMHLNNTNPLLRDDSPERAAVTRGGLGGGVGRNGARAPLRPSATESPHERRRTFPRGVRGAAGREGEARYHDHHRYHRSCTTGS